MRFVKVMDYNTRIRTLLNIDAISAIQEAPGGYYTIITSAPAPLPLEGNEGNRVRDMRAPPLKGPRKKKDAAPALNRAGAVYLWVPGLVPGPSVCTALRASRPGRNIFSHG